MRYFLLVLVLFCSSYIRAIDNSAMMNQTLSQSPYEQMFRKGAPSYSGGSASGLWMTSKQFTPIGSAAPAMVMVSGGQVSSSGTATSPVATVGIISLPSYSHSAWGGQVNAIGAENPIPIKHKLPDRPGHPGDTPLGDTPYLMLLLLLAAWGWRRYKLTVDN